MGLCIGILENQIEDIVDKVDNSKYVYKFLMETDKYDDYLESLGINVLRDCLLFSESTSSLRANRIKTPGYESRTNWLNMVELIFEDDRHVAIVNDFYDHPYMILVFPVTSFNDASRKDKHTALNEGDSKIIRELVLERLELREGIPTTTYEDCMIMGEFEEPDRALDLFNQRQEMIKKKSVDDYRKEIRNNFYEAFRFRMITYYTKLREFGLEDIMRKLRELGYLDERFDGELYLYEDEARKLLAKRLCAISYRNDIEILIEEGIIPADKLTYNLNI